MTIVRILICNLITMDELICKHFIVQGGLSTREEMCLSFPVYYPQFPDEQNLDFCMSYPTSEAYDSFTSHYSP